jgi:hypothetical protein
MGKKTLEGEVYWAGYDAGYDINGESETLQDLLGFFNKKRVRITVEDLEPQEEILTVAEMRP